MVKESILVMIIVVPSRWLISITDVLAEVEQKHCSIPNVVRELTWNF